MKKTIGLLLLVVLSVSFSSCIRDLVCLEGKGGVETRELELAPIQGILLEESAYVTITQADTQKITVTGDRNILDHLYTDVEGEIWRIDLGKNCFRDYTLDIEIQLPNIDQIAISGSGDIIVDDFKDQGDLDLLIAGSGYIKLGEFTGTNEVNASIPGSGEIFLSRDFPDLTDLDLTIPGSGEFRAFSAITNNCDVNISGSGDVYVHVLDYLKVLITGSGNVNYKGDPNIDATITGSGQIIDDN